MEVAPNQQVALQLLQAVLRQDEAAVHAALAAGSPLAFNGVTALHAAALADWAAIVPTLVEAGAELDASADLGRSDEEALQRIGPLGLAAGQAAALERWYHRKTALEVAVEAGAADVAAALLAAGARIAVQEASDFRDCHTAFKSLPVLAQSMAKELGAAAVAAVPAAVQRMAGALLSRGLLPGPAARGAHMAAVLLAYPHDPSPAGQGSSSPKPPPCPWMLEHLLQLHTSGQLGAAHAPAVADAVKALAERTARQPGAEAAAAQWLSVPAAASLDGDQLERLGCMLCEHGMTGEALPALLAQPGGREALRQHEQERLRDCLNPVRFSLVAAAAATEQPKVLDTVLAAGGTITLNDVNHFATMRACTSPRALALLLSRGVPPVPADVPPGQVVWWSACPVYALLESFVDKWDRVWEDECMKLEADALPSDAALLAMKRAAQELHATALALMDCLAEAGYRPVTFRNYRENYAPAARVLPTFYPPTDVPHSAAKWELSTTSKWLWRAALHEPWSPATHATFPPAFRAAARALLLVAHRGSSSAAAVPPRRPGLRPRRQTLPAGAAAAGLASLPPALLYHVLRLAAYPLSAWRPRMEGGSMLRDIEQLKNSSWY